MWKSWERQSDDWEGQKIIYSYTGSLLTYQYSYAFINFKQLRDEEIDYFKNLTLATLADQKFCQLNQTEFQTYQNGVWGLSACLGPDGYQAYGAKPGIALHDGTAAPYAAIGSVAQSDLSRLR